MQCDVLAQISYAGKMDGPAILDLQNPRLSTLVFEKHTVSIRDLRTTKDQFSLDAAGFCFTEHALAESIDRQEVFHHNADRPKRLSQLSKDYLADVANMLKVLTTARDIFPVPWGLLVRAVATSRLPSKNMPANFVHLDFTPRAGRDYAEKVLAKPGRTVEPYARFAIYQTWCAISPGPQDSTLAVCDGRTASMTDNVVFMSRGVDGSMSEVRLCKHSAEHRWYYLSNMQPDDMLVFKGFDSGAPDTMNAMHTAFDNPLADSRGHPRRSIEARFIALFE